MKANELVFGLSFCEQVSRNWLLMQYLFNINISAKPRNLSSAYTWYACESAICIDSQKKMVWDKKNHDFLPLAYKSVKENKAVV